MWGIVYISHRLAEVQQITTRATFLRDGRNVGTYATAELDRPRMLELLARADANTPALAIGEKAATPLNTSTAQPAVNRTVVLDVVDLQQTIGGPTVSLKVCAGERVGLYGLVVPVDLSSCMRCMGRQERSLVG